MINKKIFHKCVLCGSTSGFTNIEKDFGEKLKKHKFPYELDDFETLSYKSYSCVNCEAGDRDRLYKLYIAGYENINKKTKILDFAPSKKLEEYLRNKTRNYRSADLYLDDVDDKIDITNMKQYKNNSFDFFICSHILEHVDDDNKAISELYRVLKPGGRGILMTPIIDKDGVQDEDPKLKNIAERWRRFAQDDHVRLYEKKVFVSRVVREGFAIKVYGFWNLNIVSMIRNGISLRSRLYVLEKGKES